MARLLLLNGKPTVPGFWFVLNVNCCVFKTGELRTKKDKKYKIKIINLKKKHYLLDFFKGELVGVIFHVLYGGVSDILLPDGGVPSINWTLIF